jgi:YD repeat-containing protein
MNECESISSDPPMKTCYLLWFASVIPLLASPPGREVVRDSSGRIVRTIEHQQQADGGFRSVTRDAAGRLTGTSLTRPSGAGSSRTEHRDSSGRLTGSRQSTASGQSVDRDASGRVTCSAQSSANAGSVNRTQFRDAAGRLTGTQTSQATANGTFTGVRRDGSGRLVESSSGSGGIVRPFPPPHAVKK